MTQHHIVIGEFDEQRLRRLLKSSRRLAIRDQIHLQELRSELERAVVLRSAEVPRDIITMHAHVLVLDLASGERSAYQLVYPAEADLDSNRISVLAPLGTALLGYGVGDKVQWMMPGGLRRLRIERVLQPQDGFVKRATLLRGDQSGNEFGPEAA